MIFILDVLDACIIYSNKSKTDYTFIYCGTYAACMRIYRARLSAQQQSTKAWKRAKITSMVIANTASTHSVHIQSNKTNELIQHVSQGLSKLLPMHDQHERQQQQ